MTWLDNKQAQERMVECIEALGTREFFDPFLEFVHVVLEVDQLMLFVSTPAKEMNCLLSRNFYREGLATPLAKAYLDGAYKIDPNYQNLLELKPGELKIGHLGDLAAPMTRAYREKFFHKPGLADKISVMYSDNSIRYYLNLYRSDGKQSFRDDCLFIEPLEGRYLASLIVQHYHMNEELRNEGPLAFLSEREREVCLGILAGKKMEAVAADMEIATSSALTYRKRAYHKLGINSRGALFSLCRT